MKYVEEFRDPVKAKEYSEALHRITTRPWTLMEICGGQTHAIMRYGLQELLPEKITLVHGPGCPVCVTPLELIDAALNIASRPGVIFTSFGDMLRVPGSSKDLFTVKSEGGDIRTLYSPMEAVKIAQDNPDKEVVFFAVGFETTAPANAMAVQVAHQQDVENFSLLVSHVLVPPAMEAILSSPQCLVQGFLAAGHVCTVMGYHEYHPLAAKYQVPVVVTGFEPLDLLQGILMCVKQLEEGRHVVENQYARAVKEQGNPAARDIVENIFAVVDRKWRGIGEIPGSGLGFAPDFATFDAASRFGLSEVTVAEPEECRAGEILQGLLKPPQCSAFGTKCTPETPLGATMVSSEGACAAYYRYRGTELEVK